MSLLGLNQGLIPFQKYIFFALTPHTDLLIYLPASQSAQHERRPMFCFLEGNCVKYRVKIISQSCLLLTTGYKNIALCTNSFL